ncbi:MULTISPECIES: esterase [Cyanophyceae]|uniref:alpha/beta hydrolase n=1 Tax=Cyanophyceae TaxID=3028117 RepID=UPI0016854A04|nr:MULTISPECIES: esterase [Cyanophyceae]MBD1915812.1 esterase [Phormidium sp. FACHB-77]MBD2030514.1 esterase [Phormidium sp. FACHB-322]MBD2053516.1 esterase [Leptolyngbya sp. FACHB-60]
MLPTDQPLQALTYSPTDDTADWCLVALHGWGANAADLLGLAPYLEIANFSMVFPDAPWPHPYAPGGRMWYDFPNGYDFRRPYDFETQADLQTSRERLKIWLSMLPQTTKIPLERTILAGFSQGGAMALDVGSQLPLAGQIILSGYLHSAAQAPVSPRPVMMVHGTFDSVVPIAKAQQASAALTALGQPVTWQEMAMGHEIPPQVMGLIAGFCEDLRQARGNP